MSPLWVSYRSVTSRFPPFAFVELVSPYNKKNITRWLGRYEFYVLVARTISHEWAQRTSEILFLPFEHKIHIFSPPFNILYVFQAVFEIPSSSQVLYRQRSKSSLLLLGNLMGPSVHPRCFPQSLLALILPHKSLVKQAHHYWATRPSKIELILKLCCNISFEKLFSVRKSSSSLLMPAQKQRNESFENIRTVYRKTSEQEAKTKYQTLERKKQRNKENAMLRPLWTHQNIKVQKNSSTYHGGIYSPVRNAHTRLLSLYLLWSDQDVVVLILVCLQAVFSLRVTKMPGLGQVFSRISWKSLLKISREKQTARPLEKRSLYKDPSWIISWNKSEKYLERRYWSICIPKAV